MSCSPTSSAATPTTESTFKLTQAGALAAVHDTATDATEHGPVTAIFPDIDASKLTVIQTSNPKPRVRPDDPRIPTQSLTTDHMLKISWSVTDGWSAPSIVPYGPIPIEPTASCLHYATECFEGMKAYRSQYDGKLRLFRPRLNAQRFLKSATRIALPAFDPEEFLKCLVKFVGFEAGKWLPDTAEWRGRFLYLRPTMIGVGAKLGVQRPEEALLFVAAVLLPDGLGPPEGLKLLASKHDTIRAWPGGFGFAKVGANYGPTLVAQGEARNRGYTQVLWLFGDEGYVTESGAANFFVLWEKNGRLELVTPPLGGGLILDGVTRRSVIEAVRSGLVKDNEGRAIEVSERNIKMGEIAQANREGKLREAFACGTAVFVAGVSEIDFRGEAVMLPLSKGLDEGFTRAVKGALEDIMYGKGPHEWGFVVEESK